MKWHESTVFDVIRACQVLSSMAISHVLAGICSLRMVGEAPCYT